MRTRILKSIAFMATLLILLILGQVFGTAEVSDGASEYEITTVGGKLNPVNFAMMLLVPVLVAIGVFAVMVIAGLIRIEIESDEDKGT